MNIPPPPTPEIDYEAYYDDEAKAFWWRTSGGNYVRVDKAHLKLALRKAGFNHNSIDGAISEVDEELLKIVDSKHVIYAGPLAGHERGAQVDGRGTILITTSPCYPEPVEGDWSPLEQFWSSIFGDQDVWLYGWLKFAYESLRDKTFRPGQILVIAGERGAGKSLTQELITAILGRAAKPFRYLVGDTTFNSDMFYGEHLVIGDEAAGTDIRTRRHFGKELKQLAAESSHSCHKKMKDAFMLRPFWRCSISLNADGENIMVLPPMDESMLDKVIMVKATKGEQLNYDRSSHASLKDYLITFIPAFLDWLLSIEIPEELSCTRYGIKAWQHPSLMEALSEHAPEERMWDLIEEVMFGENREVTITAANLQESLEMGNRSANRLFSFPTACGVYLARLELKHDGRVERAEARSSWRLRSAAIKH